MGAPGKLLSTLEGRLTLSYASLMLSNLPHVSFITPQMQAKHEPVANYNITVILIFD